MPGLEDDSVTGVLNSLVTRIADGRQFQPVWRNGRGGVTYRLDGDQGGAFLKIAPQNMDPGFDSEAERLRWVRPYVPAPTIVGDGVSDGFEWIELTATPRSSGSMGRPMPRH